MTRKHPKSPRGSSPKGSSPSKNKQLHVQFNESANETFLVMDNDPEQGGEMVSSHVEEDTLLSVIALSGPIVPQMNEEKNMPDSSSVKNPQTEQPKVPEVESIRPVKQEVKLTTTPENVAEILVYLEEEEETPTKTVNAIPPVVSRPPPIVTSPPQSQHPEASKPPSTPAQIISSPLASTPGSSGQNKPPPIEDPPTHAGDVNTNPYASKRATASTRATAPRVQQQQVMSYLGGAPSAPQKAAPIPPANGRSQPVSAAPTVLAPPSSPPPSTQPPPSPQTHVPQANMLPQPVSVASSATILLQPSQAPLSPQTHAPPVPKASAQVSMSKSEEKKDEKLMVEDKMKIYTTADLQSNITNSSVPTVMKPNIEPLSQVNSSTPSSPAPPSATIAAKAPIKSFPDGPRPSTAPASSVVASQVNFAPQQTPEVLILDSSSSVGLEESKPSDSMVEEDYHQVGGYYSQVQQDQQLAKEETKPFTAVEDGEWVMYTTDSGMLYYFNTRTQVSQWTEPVAMEKEGGATTEENGLDQNPLFQACAGEEVDAASFELLVQTHNQSISSTNTEGNTPLHVASAHGHLQAVGLLIGYGANMEAKNQATGETPLLVACKFHHLELVKLLVSYGAKLNATDKDGNSIVHLAALSGNYWMLEYVMRLVLSVQGTCGMIEGMNMEEETPLHLAAKKGFADSIKLLLQHGATLDVEDSQGRTPLVLSILENHIECVQVLQHAQSMPTGQSEHQAAAELGSQGAAGEDRYVNTHDVSVSYPVATGSSNGQLNFDLARQHLYQLFHQDLNTYNIITGYLNQAEQELHTSRASVSSQNEAALLEKIQSLTTQNTELSQHLHEETQAGESLQTLLKEREVEFQTLQISHQALVTRTSMLESVSRMSQEKLKREREEHARHEEMIKAELEKSLQENAQLYESVQTLSQSLLEYQHQLHTLKTAQGEIQTQSQARLPARAMASASAHETHEYQGHTTTEMENNYYGGYTTSYSQDQSNVSAGFDFDQGVYVTSHESQGDNYGADYYEAEKYETPEAEEMEPHYDQYPVVNTSHNLPTPPCTASPESSAQQPPVSPSRVDAVWNRFFENMSRAAESTTPPLTTRKSMNSVRLFGEVKKGDIEEMNRLLLEGASPDEIDDETGRSIMHIACERGNARAVTLLCEYSADLEIQDHEGNTPLLTACAAGKFECVKFLLQSAAELEAVNEQGDTALHLAAWKGAYECVEILLEYGIDPFAKNRFGQTALQNVRTRSPMRHKLDDLDASHPMLRTLVLLEEAEEEYEDTTASSPHSNSTKEICMAPSRPPPLVSGNSSSNPAKLPVQTSSPAIASRPPPIPASTQSGEEELEEEEGEEVGEGEEEEYEEYEVEEVKATWKQWIFGSVFGGKKQEEQDEEEEEVEEGEEEEAPLSRPPIDTDFNSTAKFEPLSPPSDILEALKANKKNDLREALPHLPPPPPEVLQALKNAATSPISSPSNRFSMVQSPTGSQGVRSRYVDTFNSA